MFSAFITQDKILALSSFYGTLMSVSSLDVTHKPLKIFLPFPILFSFSALIG